ncbi:hypothetical protein [Massilia aurea]|uniref:hypothetical protein n=1 Tax=Massilia aurea TaxID=373040 RepID=UPI0016175AB5|nr:hypothetical protein [Massilia aurea]
MKMIIMVTPCLYQRTAHLAHLGVVEVDELDEGVSQKQADFCWTQVHLTLEKHSQISS